MAIGAHRLHARSFPPSPEASCYDDWAVPDPCPLYLSRRLDVTTRGRGLYEITADVVRFVSDSGIRTGLCVVFCRHTSASLLIQENADPSVKTDLLDWLARVAPDSESLYQHDSEGPDDMPSHIRSAITRTSETIPIDNGRLVLGTWQGIYVLEHRTLRHRREVALHLQGLP